MSFPTVNRGIFIEKSKRDIQVICMKKGEGFPPIFTNLTKNGKIQGLVIRLPL